MSETKIGLSEIKDITAVAAELSLNQTTASHESVVSSVPMEVCLVGIVRAQNSRLTPLNSSLATHLSPARSDIYQEQVRAA
jgi:hypothetical protein